MKKTKIICTMGPSSADRETIKKMFLAGMNVGRINMSHGDHETHAKTIAMFREVRDELGVDGAVLLDTKGPEIRMGTFSGGPVELKKGATFTFTTDDVDGDENRVFVTYADFPKEVGKGDLILADDGKIEFEVKEVRGNDVVCTAVNGGIIKNRKGINLPHIKLSMPYLSERDISDIKFGVANDVDCIAASFTRSKNDVEDLRALLKKEGGEDIRIIAKIESNEGIDNFEEILEAADGIMIARGDMGVEIAFERLPSIQKMMIKRCVERGKTVVTATQMLESMISNPVPTRAEITDVANAVYDGTGAIMLSGETAAGDYPVEAVTVMNRIAIRAEEDMKNMAIGRVLNMEMDLSDTTNAVGHSASTLAKDIGAKAIMAVTRTGCTARRMAKFRPQTQIIALTACDKTYNQMALEWGVAPIKTDPHEDLEERIAFCIKEAEKKGYIAKGDKVVFSLGLPLDIPGNTNMIRVETVK